MADTRFRKSRFAATAAVFGAAAIAALSTSAPAQAQGDVRGQGQAGAISGSYIVVLDDAEANAQSLAGRYGADVENVWSAAIDGFEATMSASEARRMAADPAVDYVEQNSEVHVLDQSSPPSWGLDRIDQRDLPLDDYYGYDSTGAGVTAYIIDTGIRTSHEDFEGRATWGTSTARGPKKDCNGHGTHVAGTVGGAQHGVAKDVSLVAVKVLDCNGSGTWAGVIDGIDWVTDNAQKPAVANMSLGGGYNSTINDAVQRSIDSGVSYAVAAGNEDTDACTKSPASTPDAITVGATDDTDTRAYFSNYGDCVDIFAPGVAITSTWNGSDTDTTTISGTSMAAPHVAGAAALYLEGSPGASPDQVTNALTGNATTGVVNDPLGSPNLLLYTG